jgi:hypothetical protein
MKEFIITEDLANAVLAYLNTKPHGEVRRMIDQLAQIKPVEPKAEAEKEAA